MFSNLEVVEQDFLMSFSSFSCCKHHVVIPVWGNIGKINLEIPEFPFPVGLGRGAGENSVV
jgi:hypothetical protein